MPITLQIFSFPEWLITSAPEQVGVCILVPTLLTSPQYFFILLIAKYHAQLAPGWGIFSEYAFLSTLNFQMSLKNLVFVEIPLKIDNFVRFTMQLIYAMIWFFTLLLILISIYIFFTIFCFQKIRSVHNLHYFMKNSTPIISA